MKPGRVGGLMAALLLAGVVLYGVFAGTGSSSQSSLKLAVPAGASYVYAQYISNEYKPPVEVVASFELYQLQDCCSNKTQMALRAGEADAAVLCDAAAKALISKDSNYQIIGDWIRGSDVLVVRDHTKVSSIAVASGRSYQAAAIRKKFGSDRKIMNILPSSMLYALETGQAEGAVLDISSVPYLPEGYLPVMSLPGSGNRQVLVAKQKIVGTPAFDAFRQAWQKAAADLQDPGQLELCLHNKSERKEVEGWSPKQKAEVWKRMGIVIPVPDGNP
ncbi:MAG: ABC transporter substrate-binding (seleno)protein SaoB [Syntrophomonas sp.]